MQVQKSGGVGSHAKEEGVSEIHLAGKTGQEVPAGREDGENAGQDQDAQQVRILGNHGQEEENKKEKKNGNPAGQDEYLPLKNGIKISQVESQGSHPYLSSSKAMPKRPSGLINSTRIMMDRATEPLR